MPVACKRHPKCVRVTLLCRALSLFFLAGRFAQHRFVHFNAQIRSSNVSRPHISTFTFLTHVFSTFSASTYTSRRRLCLLQSRGSFASVFALPSCCWPISSSSALPTSHAPAMLVFASFRKGRNFNPEYHTPFLPLRLVRDIHTENKATTKNEYHVSLAGGQQQCARR